jgi:hypothetical protein
MSISHHIHFSLDVQRPQLQSTSSETILKEDSKLTLDEVKALLVHMVRMDVGEKNIFNVHDSMESMNTDNGLLSLQVPMLNGFPDLIFSEEIYSAEKAIGINLPVDQLCKVRQKVIVLIGVSGCGKTRTCFDLCRSLWCVYFDCTEDADFSAMVEQLVLIRPQTKTETSQQLFEEQSQRLIKCLLAARFLVLWVILYNDPSVKPFDWLCIQRSARTRSLFSTLFERLARFPFAISSAIFKELKDWFPSEGRIIFDESQYLLDLLPNDYRSKKPHQRDITAQGQFAYPRSFFSFLTGYIYRTQLRSIWCGTQMRIRSMELLYSAAGIKDDSVYIFTHFNYLEPKHIFALMCTWLKPAELRSGLVILYEEIAHFLQGRPRFFISFLHRLIHSTDLSGTFATYRRLMTTNSDSSLSHSSPYFFWKERIHWTIEPFSPKYNSPFSKMLVSDTLLRLCLSFLFGDGTNIDYSPDLDLVSTSLVMVSNTVNGWQACMAEPIVLSAGLNYLADQDSNILMKYFADQLFCPLGPPNLSPQARGTLMEFVIALRFIQGWWLEPSLQTFLPEWTRSMDIPKPLGVLDSRSKGANLNLFMQQLVNPVFPWGPDLRYSVFSCCVKTTWVSNFKSSMNLSVEESKYNLETMNHANWYKSQDSIFDSCKEQTNKNRFVHLQFELPDTAPSLKGDFVSRDGENDSVICVNLDSEFAVKFFGDEFVQRYKQFRTNVISS